MGRVLDFDVCAYFVNGLVQDVCAAGLRADGSGLLVSVSRAMSSKATQGAGAMAVEARRLRDEINTCREQFTSSSKKNASASLTDSVAVAIAKSPPTQDAPSAVSVPVLKDYQREFIELALQLRSLQFGTFTLKSGRVSPYFFNAGTFCTASSLCALGR
jgi:hypothetical protein